MVELTWGNEHEFGGVIVILEGAARLHLRLKLQLNSSS
jgi:hypothetical protein